MKTILVPTDYSATADNAMWYAAELAKFEYAKIILFHAYIPRVLLSSLTLMNGGFEEENLNKLKHYKLEIEKKNGKVPEIEIMTRSGFTVNGILSVIRDRKIDLVVMGTTGSNPVKEVLLGNTTTNILQSTDVPVLVIPPNAKFTIPKKIGVALDQVEKVPTVLKKNITKYVNEFKSRLVIFNLLGQEAHAVMGIDDESEEGNKIMGDLNYELCRFNGHNLIEELNMRIDHQKVDWIIMAPQNHPELSELFYQSNTEKMAFHTHIPLLSIHI